MQNVTLSILTWKAPQTLQRTLASLAPVQDLFSHRLVVCQEGDPDEIGIAERYGFKPVPTERNVGIQEGLALTVESAPTDIVLAMENDCAYLGGAEGKASLAGVIDAFVREGLDVVKLGELPPEPRPRYTRYWGMTSPPRRTLLGMVRWKDANGCKAEALTLKDFDVRQVTELTKISDTLYATTSRYIGWTNRAFLVRKPFFLDTILPFARAHPGAKRVNGTPDLEYPLNCPANRGWWRGKDFQVGVTRPGFFGHQRVDRPKDDEKFGIC